MSSESQLGGTFALAAIMARRGGKKGGEDPERRSNVLGEPSAPCGGRLSGSISVNAGAASAENTQVNGGSTESPTLGEGVVTDAVKLGTVTPAAQSIERGEPSHAGLPSGELAVSAPAPTLEWLKPQGMGVKTKCGRYSCCKTVSNGKTTYELWAFVPSANWFTIVRAGMQSFQEAKDLALKHVNRQHREGA